MAMVKYTFNCLLVSCKLSNKNGFLCLLRWNKRRNKTHKNLIITTTTVQYIYIYTHIKQTETRLCLEPSVVKHRSNFVHLPGLRRFPGDSRSWWRTWTQEFGVSGYNPLDSSPEIHSLRFLVCPLTLGQTVLNGKKQRGISTRSSHQDYLVVKVKV